MERVKYKKDNKSQKHSSDDSDTEWKPSKLKKRRSNSFDDGCLEELVTFRESGEEIDIGRANTCPICSKSFSRNAALMCHIKQNHSYMLKKNKVENSIDSMKEDIMEWENRVSKEEKFNVSRERDYDTTDRTQSKESSNETSSDSSIKASNSFEQFDDDDDDDDDQGNFPIIGGSFVGNGDEKLQPVCARMSFFTSDSTNSELIDPDQSFSVVRKGVRRNGKRKKEIQKSRIVNNNSMQCEKRDDFNFSSIDFSIDNNNYNRKRFKCSVCNGYFSSSVLLTYHHMRNHMKEFQQCPDCGNVYYDTLLFKAHTNLHRK